MNTHSQHDHQKCVHHALHTAQQLCDERSIQWTPVRQQVLELIWASHKAVKAYDLLEQLKQSQNTAKPATIYRALDFLLAQGLIHRIESLNAFIGCCCSEIQHEQLLLICKECLEVEERPAKAVMDSLNNELQEAGFTLHHKALEIHGICANCSTEKH